MTLCHASCSFLYCSSPHPRCPWRKSHPNPRRSQMRFSLVPTIRYCHNLVGFGSYESQSYRIDGGRKGNLGTFGTVFDSRTTASVSCAFDSAGCKGPVEQGACQGVGLPGSDGEQMAQTVSWPIGLPGLLMRRVAANRAVMARKPAGAFWLCWINRPRRAMRVGTGGCFPRPWVTWTRSTSGRCCAATASPCSGAVPAGINGRANHRKSAAGIGADRRA